MLSPSSMGSRLLLIVVLCYPALALGKSYFTAAVFEHRHRNNAAMDTLEVITSNLRYYERAVKVAADKGADIILFNEFGVFPYNEDRTVLRKFVENIPDPKKIKFNPCVDGAENLPILATLSCMARKNNIYVVGNMGDVKPCEGSCDADKIEGCDQKCPEDGIFMYNTNVAFDRKGNLIARYHKMHPYFENNNVPQEPEYETFKTDFGTFGLVVCFDSVFDDSMILARDYGIDTLLFPTFWFDDILPFNGVEWQQSWAIANNVNFIAANTQTPGNGSIGSGIYSKDKGALVYTYEPDGESKLLVANLPIGKLEKKYEVKPSITVINEASDQPKEENGDAFPEHGYDKLVGPANNYFTDYRVYKSQTEKYTVVKLETKNGQVEACNNKFCCQLTYSADDMAEEYYFGAFSGLNDAVGYYHWCEETCLLVRCDPLEDKPCITQPSRSKTVFKSLKITADFTSEKVYPTVSKNKFRLASKKEWEFKRKGSKAILEFKSSTDEPLLKAGLIGRCYDRDPLFEPYYKY